MPTMIKINGIEYEVPESVYDCMMLLGEELKAKEAITDELEYLRDAVRTMRIRNRQ